MSFDTTSSMMHESARLAIDSKGEYILVFGESWFAVAKPREPDNRDRIYQAGRAVKLGLSVAAPAPVYSLPKGVAVGGTREEIEAILELAYARIRYSPTMVVGKQIVKETPLHGDSCDCGNCEYQYEYSDEDVIEPGFEVAPGIIPPEWVEDAPNSMRRISVVSSDGRWRFAGTIRGTGGSGGLCTPHIARMYGVQDPAILHRLEKLNEASEHRWRARCAEQENEERAKLAKMFGV